MELVFKDIMVNSGVDKSASCKSQIFSTKQIKEAHAIPTLCFIKYNKWNKAGHIYAQIWIVVVD